MTPAEEIVALRAQVAELREAAQLFIAWVDYAGGMPDENMLDSAVMATRAALAKVTP